MLVREGMITLALTLAIAAGDTATVARTDGCPGSSVLVGPGDPCPMPGPFVVFFEPGRAEITPRAAQILNFLLEQHRSVGRPPIVISGHADRLGADEYNSALSRRRADAVARYLAEGRVPEHLMRVEWFGEGRPALATADGRADPQNRRVEIVLESVPSS
jgi:outer membrane protein OmpA-like peptidoglycan-associated protein